MLDLSPTKIFLGVLLIGALGGVGLFVVDAGSTTPDPVSFDDTVPVGLTLEAERGLDDQVELPRAQVFYSQYQYVVGYYGVETFVESQRQTEHEQRFGHPLAVYVSDYSDTGLELTDDGYPTTDRRPTWTNAEAAWFVVDSEARTPAGETVIPFTDRDEAAAFAEEYNGTVHGWETVLETSFDRDDATVARDRVDDHRQLADDRVDATAAYDDRPTSVVVGEDTETVQEAIDTAPANTTVVVSEGTYAETVEIDRPISLVGEGDVTLRGDDNGTVVTVTSERVALENLELTGVGNVTREGDELPVEIDEEWDATFTQYYAGTDAGIAAYTADELLVQDVRIETPASGVIAYDSTDAVFRNVAVDGPDDPTDGLAGMLLFQSPSVIEDSTYQGGQNGIYLYRSPTTVIRSSSFDGHRLGIHLMHTDDTLIADNDIQNQHSAGIYIMTGPERNAIVGNTITESAIGISVGGSNTYVAENLVDESELGMRLDTTASIYEGNVFAGNDVGVDVSAMLPTNRVVGNDFVGNGEHAAATSGPLRIWSQDGVGNYWQGAATIADGGHADLSYSPTDDVDKRLHLTDGVQTLTRAPALRALSGLEGSVPGMRTGSIVDQTPACEPTNPDRLDRTAWADHAWTCYETTHDEP
ncbi:NosD domain-containing protein [Natronorubrum thiooxidans]|uniref:Nitrous oxidase accessory protein NosD, contains tandem CASH domains n=1 Tax=Natronorubrum thiooxidans TaxID=308853 RepID=A0A1N7DCA3_9EURY|nr:NosD domain-containing protein [Natronorubrum thiooxidans]SIR73404.1 Nitrous oxidase accessory protein NosD, contains tandem CASH domains [Natronorubrum thiooxidans]